MNKWFYRAVGTVGVASGFLLLASGAAQADKADVAPPTVDPQQLRGMFDALFTPTAGKLSLAPTGHDRAMEALVSGRPLKTLSSDALGSEGLGSEGLPGNVSGSPLSVVRHEGLLGREELLGHNGLPGHEELRRDDDLTGVASESALSAPGAPETERQAIHTGLIGLPKPSPALPGRALTNQTLPGQSLADLGLSEPGLSTLIPADNAALPGPVIPGRAMTNNSHAGRTPSAKALPGQAVASKVLGNKTAGKALTGKALTGTPLSVKRLTGKTLNGQALTGELAQELPGITAAPTGRDNASTHGASTHGASTHGASTHGDAAAVPVDGVSPVSNPGTLGALPLRSDQTSLPVRADQLKSTQIADALPRDALPASAGPTVRPGLVGTALPLTGPMDVDWATGDAQLPAMIGNILGTRQPDLRKATQPAADELPLTGVVHMLDGMSALGVPSAITGRGLPATDTLPGDVGRTATGAAPLTELPLTELPVADVPVADVPVADLPLAELPLTELPLADLPLAGLPLAGLPSGGERAAPSTAMDMAPAVSKSTRQLSNLLRSIQPAGAGRHAAPRAGRHAAKPGRHAASGGWTSAPGRRTSDATANRVANRAAERPVAGEDADFR